MSGTVLFLAVSFLPFDTARRLLFLKGVLIRCDLLVSLGWFVLSLYYPCAAGLLCWSGSHFSPLQGCELKKRRVRCAGGNVLLM